jgi:hypothetical protein
MNSNYVLQHYYLLTQKWTDRITLMNKRVLFRLIYTNTDTIMLEGFSPRGAIAHGELGCGLAHFESEEEP